MSDEELEQSRSKLEDVRIGGLAATSASYLLLILMLFPLAVIRSVRAAIDNKRKRAALELQIEQLSASLGVPSPALLPSDLGRSLAWTALVLGGTTLAALGLTIAF